MNSIQTTADIKSNVILSKRDPDSLELEILYKMEEMLAQYWNDSRSKPWTTRIKETLCEIAKNKGYIPYSSTEDTRHKEWMWDVTWCSELNNNWKQFTKLELICESEWWSLDEIVSDFQKLLVGNAKYRILITEYYTNSIKSWDNIVNECEKAIISYGERKNNYLLIGLPYYDDEKAKGVMQLALSY